jgi:hypothetical protein
MRYPAPSKKTPGPHPWNRRRIVMKSTVRSLVGVIALAAVTSLSLAQTPPAPPKPTAEHQNLARFVGKWSGKGEMKPGPMGPGGKSSWTENCEWFAGNFHVVCKTDGTGPNGAMKGLGIIGYDAEQKKYYYYGVNNEGMGEVAYGTLQGKTWTFTSESRMGGKVYQGRFVIEETSNNSQKFNWDMSEDGKTWNTMMEGSSTK